jgi:hypothetical protein
MYEEDDYNIHQSRQQKKKPNQEQTKNNMCVLTNKIE